MSFIPPEDQDLLKNTIELLCYKICLRTNANSWTRFREFAELLKHIQDSLDDLESTCLTKWKTLGLRARSSKKNLRKLLTSKNPFVRELAKKEIKDV